jgi:V/A-type H+-transporting ATPase subunit I
MAIAKINKIETIGLQEDKERFLNLLQQLGLVELAALRESTAAAPAQMVSEADILETEEALSFLSSFQEKSGFLKGMVNLKPVVYQEQLKDIIANFDYRSLLRQLSELRNHLKNLIQHKERLGQERQLLIPWHKLNIALDQIHSTQNCGILLGSFYTRDYLKILGDFQSENINLFFEIVNQDKTNTYVVIIYIQEDFERLQAILKGYHFNFATLSHHKCKVKDRLFEIDSEALIFDDSMQDIKTKVADLLKQQFRLMVVYDYLVNIRKRQEANKNLNQQQFTFSLSGWIRHKDVQILEQAVAPKFRNLAIFISEPKADEDLPVVLENNRIIQPFEFITQIYGMPKYNELDPTPFLAPFFFLYFGFCVSDVGYGVILALVSWLALKKFKMGRQGTKFFKLFLFCGISTIIVGALTGSWFGNLFELLAESNKIFLPLKRFKDALVILDPIKEPTKLLGVALSLGIVQVWFGNIVAGIGNIKNKRYLDIVFDQVPMLTLLLGLTGLGLIFLKLFAKTHMNFFKYSTLLGGLTLILTQGRFEKGWGAKLFYGMYNFYNALSGYLSDVLSYSRLWALGLVTGVMASTINLISIQISQIFGSAVPFINKISFFKILISSLLIIVVFVSGHIVSFLMSLLGAFVHPVRLQFVEFFSKFFKSGGSSFKPFKLETKYINIS